MWLETLYSLSPTTVEGVCVCTQIDCLGGALRDKAGKMETYCQSAVIKRLQACKASHKHRAQTDKVSWLNYKPTQHHTYKSLSDWIKTESSK